MRDPKLAHILVSRLFSPAAGVVGAESCFSTTVAYVLGVSCEGRGEVPSCWLFLKYLSRSTKTSFPFTGIYSYIP